MLLDLPVVKEDMPEGCLAYTAFAVQDEVDSCDRKLGPKIRQQEVTTRKERGILNGRARRVDGSERLLELCEFGLAPRRLIRHRPNTGMSRERITSRRRRRPSARGFRRSTDSTHLPT